MAMFCKFSAFWLLVFIDSFCVLYGIPLADVFLVRSFILFLFPCFSNFALFFELDYDNSFALGLL